MVVQAFNANAWEQKQEDLCELKVSLLYKEFQDSQSYPGKPCLQ